MTFRQTTIAAIAFALALVVADAAAAQSGPQPGARGNRGTPQSQSGPAAPTCVPSGFSRLRRNCNADVGSCQRMPESCSYGWCCP